MQRAGGEPTSQPCEEGSHFNSIERVLMSGFAQFEFSSARVHHRLDMIARILGTNCGHPVVSFPIKENKKNQPINIQSNQ